MSCIYNQFQGKCTLYDEDSEIDDTEMGFNKDGFCVVDNDPWPWDSCANFEPTDASEYEIEED